LSLLRSGGIFELEFLLAVSSQLLSHLLLKSAHLLLTKHDALDTIPFLSTSRQISLNSSRQQTETNVIVDLFTSMKDSYL